MADSLGEGTYDLVDLAHFHAADPGYGRRVEEAVHALREN
ncbi:hypothetical protein GCM10017668_57170 [Streptomyces tuirus]|uniref:Uncharacterized protein n=1 Tax=Streptomyces tuirus TaxID=68278 RepID=A0A7G1NQF3_9ACTN|nr:hypothetical protein GCM10017668_57170 [Streptomyces tuirus]